MAIGDAIYLLLANRQDIYFNRHLMKLDYERYLYQLLREQGYEHVFYFEEANGQEIDLFCETVADKDEYRNKSQGFWGSLSVAQDDSLGRIRYRFRLKDKDIRQNFIKLIKSEQNDRYAFILQAELFGRLYRNMADQSDFVQVMNTSRYSKGSIFVLTDAMPDSFPEQLKPGREILWKPFERRQLERMLCRVYVAGQMHGREYFKAQYTLLCEELCDGDRHKIADWHVENNAELYRVLSDRSKFERISELAMRNDMHI